MEELVSGLGLHTVTAGGNKRPGSVSLIGSTIKTVKTKLACSAQDFPRCRSRNAFSALTECHLPESCQYTEHSPELWPETDLAGIVMNHAGPDV